jgi:thioredoxin reductase (NADPH)
MAGRQDGSMFCSELADGTTIRSRSVLCTTGVSWRRIEVPGSERLLHAGVYYGSATSEAPGVRGKDVLVIGGGNSAGQAAMNFADLARSVTLVVRGQGLAASMSSYLSRRIDATSNIAIRNHSELVAVDGDDWLRNVTLRDTVTGVRRTLDAHAVFICIGGVPHTEWLRHAGVLVDVSDTS